MCLRQESLPGELVLEGSFPLYDKFLRASTVRPSCLEHSRKYSASGNQGHRSTQPRTLPHLRSYMRKRAPPPSQGAVMKNCCLGTAW